MPVLRRVRLRPQLPHHVPVHAHLSAGNQQLTMPPPTNPRPRNNLPQSFFHGFFLKVFSGRARHFVPFFRLDLRLLFPTSLPLYPRLLTLPPPWPSAFRRSPPPAFLHCSPPSLPAIPPALPSPPDPWVQRLLHGSPALVPRCSPRQSTHSPPAQIPRRSPTLPAPAPQTPSNAATPPDRSARTASKIPSTSCTKSAGPSLLCAPPSHSSACPPAC